MTHAKKSRLDPALEKAITKMLKEVMADPNTSLTDRCKVVDRALKLEQIKQRMSDDTYGSGFFSDDEGG